MRIAAVDGLADEGVRLLEGQGHEVVIHLPEGMDLGDALAGLMRSSSVQPPNSMSRRFVVQVKGTSEPSVGQGLVWTASMSLQRPTWESQW